MKGTRTYGWLEPGDRVKDGDLYVTNKGDWLVVPSGGYVHKARHAPKWRPPVQPPAREERMVMLAIAEERRAR